MQVRQWVTTRLDDAELVPLKDVEANLVLVFAAPKFFAEPDFAPWLARAFPDARRVAVSTAGEIGSEGVGDDTIVVTAVRFERTPLRIVSTHITGMDDSRAAGQRLAQQLAGELPRAVMLFSQGVAVNGSDLIAGVASVLGTHVPLTGGLAGDNGAFTQTWVMLDNEVSNRLVVAVGFYGDALQFNHASFGGWQSFGPARRATRAVGNILFELDGEPALALYKRYLGDYAEGLPASGLLFPFALLSDDKAETGLIRTPLGIDESAGSLIMAGDIPENAFLRLMHASTEALVDGAQEAAEHALACAASDHASLAILVSCVGRKLVMGGRIDEELEAVAEVFGPRCALAGFYSNGEISPFLETAECKLHNQTMTITLLGEK